MTEHTCICGDASCVIQYGECHCGCRGKTNLAPQTLRWKRWIRGEPKLYIAGHNCRGKKYAAKGQNEIEREVIDSIPCIRMKLSRGLWTVLWESDYPLVKDMRWWASNNGYAFCTSPEGKNIQMARIIMATSGDMEPDHIHGNRLDNRRSELRNVTSQQNHFNQKRPVCNTSGFKGVSRGKGIQWRARIVFNGQEYHLGSFKTELDAAKARAEAEIKFFGEFRRKA